MDEHNRQHTFGNSLGPPSSVVGVSAQQAIDNHNRLVQSSMSGAPSGSSGAGPRARHYILFTLVCAAIFAAALTAAYLVGGIGAVAIGLVALIAALFGIIFLIAAIIESMKNGVASIRGAGKPPQRT